MNDHECTPVGSMEIAQHLGVQGNTIHVYTKRGLLPAPRWATSGKPTWCLEHDVLPLPWVRRRLERMNDSVATAC